MSNIKNKGKLIFFTPKMNLGGDASPGIQKKVKAQVDAFERIGFQVKLINFAPHRYPPSLFKKLNIFGELSRSNTYYTSQFDNALDELLSFDPDAIYIRYNFTERQFFRFLSELRKAVGSEIPIYLEIPTYPYDKELLASGNLGLIALYFADSFYRRKLSKYIDYIVTYSNYESIFGIPTIKIGNGVDVEKIIPVTPQPNTKVKREYHIIGVSNLVFWVGYDRIIKGLKEYVKDSSNPMVHFHVVGEGPVKNSLELLTTGEDVEDFVSFHGTHYGSSLDDLFTQAQLAVGNLGGHRRGLISNQDLKNREYCARGIPFVTSTIDPGFPADFQYLMQAPPDESSIDIKKLVKFIDDLQREQPDYVSKMRHFAEKHFDWAVTLKPVVERMKS